MKKLLALLMLLPLCFSVAFADELLLGSYGEDVLQVQQRLIELGYMSGTADGQYGNQTMVAVMQFQKANGLAQTGVTNDSLRKLLFSNGVQADDTVLAQNRLIALGYLSGMADGIWGAQSVEAMKHFQRVNDIAQTGEPDEVTLQILFAETAKRDMTMVAQKNLADMGYYAGAVDGIVNDEMLRAIAVYQRLNGLEETGAADETTLQMICDGTARYTKLQAGSDGDAVKALQERLIRLGFMEGVADGDYGKQTSAAVKAFQEHLNAQGEVVVVNGAATALTQEYLFSEHYSIYLKDLRAGDVDNEVLRIERRLALLGYMDAPADDVFDNYAVDALMGYQTAAGLPVSGIADRETVTHMFAENAIVTDQFVPHAIALGDSGAAVRCVQEALRLYGMFAYPADGEYSADVQSALERMYAYLTGMQNPNAEWFAQADSLSVEAQNMLCEQDLFTYVEFDSADKEAVKRLQRRLCALYHMAPVHVDGDYGKTTKAAVTAFQTNNGLEATGIMDEATQRKLYSAEAKRNLTPYKLDISIADQRVYVYQLNEDGEYEHIDTFICSTGLGNTTPKGVFVGTQPLNRWHFFKKFKCWAQYSYQIDGDILFHSVLYDSNDTRTLRYNSVYALGQKASHGCIRLKPEDAKWIYYNCAKGTIVEVY